MKASASKQGLTVRVIAGTTNVIIGMDLDAAQRKGCLGFSIARTDLGRADKAASEPSAPQWLPNMLSFKNDKTPVDPKSPITTERSPLQKFRWGDYTCVSGHRYRYQVVPRYGTAKALTPPELKPDLGVTVDVTTENNASESTAVFFNRAAAASRAFDLEFPTIRTEALLEGSSAEAKKAQEWLSRGMEEALVAFIASAADDTFAIHAAIYEFQKPSLLAALAEAKKRNVEVKVVYHHRSKGGSDTTAQKNDKAIKAAKLPSAILIPRDANPQGAIMHNKFVVLLKKDGAAFTPTRVWTGSMNWTDGAVYGQLNVGHIITDDDAAAKYEAYFQILAKDPDAEDTKHAVSTLTPVSVLVPTGSGTTPIFSPQSTDTMLHLYSSICAQAQSVFVCAPFALSPIILAAFTSKTASQRLRFFLLDKESSLGRGQEVSVIENDPNNAISIAVTLPSALHDFQGRLLEGKESFRHAGIHIHSKIILADPFGSDPILVMGSANFSQNSTEVNDSNSIVFRGQSAIADIYATEFMRMFEHYHFRASEAKAEKKVNAAAAPSTVLSLVEDDSWSGPYYVAGSQEEFDRRLFAGTVH